MGQVVLLHADECWPPHKVSRSEQVCQLEEQFRVEGWGAGYPNLVGYPWEGRIQLLNGSHRWAAANQIHMPVPVVVVSYEQVEQAWGNLEEWQQIMQLGDCDAVASKSTA